MLWNVYVIAESQCRQINSEPYDAEQVAMALDLLPDTVDAVTLVPRDRSRSLDLLDAEDLAHAEDLVDTPEGINASASFPRKWTRSQSVSRR